MTNLLVQSHSLPNPDLPLSSDPSDSSGSLSLIPSIFHSFDAKFSEVDKKVTKSCPKEKMEENIALSFEEAEKIKGEIEHLGQKIENLDSRSFILYIAQFWAADIILKGGARSSKSSLYFLFNTQQLRQLDVSTEIIKVIADIFDTGIGSFEIFYKYYFIEGAEKQIAKFREKGDLTPDQLARLEQLEKVIQEEKEHFPLFVIEQSFRFTRNIISYATFALSWIEKTSFVTSLVDTANIIIGGFNTLIYGALFYHARENFKDVKNWTSDFEKSHPTTPEEKLIAKRSEREQKRAEKVKEQLRSGKLDRKTVEKRVIKFKSEGFKHFLNGLPIKDLKVKELQEEIEKRLGVVIPLPLVQDLRSCYIQKLDQNLPKEKAQEIEKELSKKLKECMKEWRKGQKDEDILSFYLEYQSVIDVTLKSSLRELVSKKLEIEKNILQFNAGTLGGKFTASAIVFGVGLSLLIIAAVSNPVGAAALVMTCLAVSFGVLAIGLTGASYYYTYEQKPLSTKALLQGVTVQIFYYRLRATLRELREGIDKYFQKAWQEKTEQISAYIGRFSLSQSNSQIEMDQFVDEKMGKIQLSYQESQNQVEKWRKKADLLEEEFQKMAWEDFSKQAGLSSETFDTLETFKEALSQCDLSLLSKETRALFEKQLGLPLPILQKEIEKDKEAIKQLMRDFFILDETMFAKFVSQQTTGLS